MSEGICALDWPAPAPVPVLDTLLEKQARLTRVCEVLMRKAQLIPADREIHRMLDQALHKLERLNRRVIAERRMHVQQFGRN